MIIKSNSPEEYISKIDNPEKREAIIKLRDVIMKNIPKGFEECINYNMISYVVPHSTYPNGYHCDPSLPLPFVSIAAQKNFIAVYHMGVYMKPELLKWFTDEYKKSVKSKLDMGKSCIRFKKPDEIPVELIGKLISKMSVKQWINLYESVLMTSRKRK